MSERQRRQEDRGRDKCTHRVRPPLTPRISRMNIQRPLPLRLGGLAGGVAAGRGGDFEAADDGFAVEAEVVGGGHSGGWGAGAEGEVVGGSLGGGGGMAVEAEGAGAGCGCGGRAEVEVIG
jgi:hypothetical protein